MNYLIFDAETEAAARSAVEAQARGCSGTTTHWWGWRQTAAGKWALLLGSDTAAGSTSAEPEWPVEEAEA